MGDKRYHGVLTSCLSITAVRYPVVYSTSPLLFGALMSQSAPLGVTNLHVVIKVTIQKGITGIPQPVEGNRTIIWLVC